MTNGSLLAYTVEEGSTTALRLRPLNSGDSTRLRGTEGAVNPFLSPDGKWIAFFAGAKLKKVEEARKP